MGVRRGQRSLNQTLQGRQTGEKQNLQEIDDGALSRAYTGINAYWFEVNKGGEDLSLANQPVLGVFLPVC